MSRLKLKCGGKPRKKALFGADGAIMAAATLAAAGMQVAATTSAAKSQAKAMTESANIQAKSIKEQSTNNTNLQKESINFTRQQNAENRQQQQDIQTTLQMLAGQENMNSRMERNKVAVKYGGRPKRESLKRQPFYGGGSQPFNVTDGGGVIPLTTDANGYGLYELYGNDHEHYHKAPGGKSKTGVGIKFNDGSVVEGEGNQNSNKGELLYVTPNDAMFISKHSIKGFNPRQAVENGVHPVQAFAMQELIKKQNGLNDDGSSKRNSLKKAEFGGQQMLNDVANITYLPSNGTASVAAGAAYAAQNKDNTTSPVARCGKRISIKRCGGNVRPKAKWGDYAGATYNAAGNLLGAGITTWGNMYAANKLGQAYSASADIIADAYRNMSTIDDSFISREDYSAPHTMAVVRAANTNINPQLERLRRNAAYERKEINRGTLSSAARQNRLAATNDRLMQRQGEQYAWKQNQDEQIYQSNAERITQTAQANADRDIQANKDYTAARLSLKEYNNNIENQKLAGIAQAYADAISQTSSANAGALQSSSTAISSALTASAQGFGNAYDANKKINADYNNMMVGVDTENAVRTVIESPDKYNNKERAKNMWKAFKDSNDEKYQKYAALLANAFGFK
jgi:hypothetical protein